jgi:hypothetical protein
LTTSTGATLLALDDFTLALRFVETPVAFRLPPVRLVDDDEVTTVSSDIGGIGEGIRELWTSSREDAAEAVTRLGSVPLAEESMVSLNYL